MIKKSLIFIFIMFGIVIGLSNNVFATTETANTYYLSHDFDYWTLTTPPANVVYTEILKVDLQGDMNYLNASVVNDKTIIWGSKDVYVNLNGTQDLFFADSWNWESHNNTFESFFADSIIIRGSRLWFMLDGVVSKDYTVNQILNGLNGSNTFYIIRTVDIDEYQQGYNSGVEQGLSRGKVIGYDEGWDDGFRDGFDEGVNESYETGGFGVLLASAFSAVGVLLSIQLLPNITIGAIVAIPIVFGVVMFIIGRRKQ